MTHPRPCAAHRIADARTMPAARRTLLELHLFNALSAAPSPRAAVPARDDLKVLR